MPYMEKRILSGKYLEVEVYPVSVNGKRLPNRRDKEKPSSEAQKKLNDKNARKKLARLMNCNFDEVDLFLTLTHKDKDTITESEMRNEETNFFRRLKAERERRDLPELKYISVSGKDKKNGIHIHAVVSGDGMTRDEVEAVWSRGRARTSYLEEDENGFEGLANYFIKNQKQLDTSPNKRKWRQSKNLEKPIVSPPKIVKRVSAKKEPKPPKGYKLITYNTVVNDYSGAVYRHVLYKKLE